MIMYRSIFSVWFVVVVVKLREMERFEYFGNKINRWRWWVDLGREVKRRLISCVGLENWYYRDILRILVVNGYKF